ncbi:unnamed protein product [Paramecium sonneborni]|uniref:Uncharacterized protein n=1 Tax=Paramecium sonneborni TaxID=65129 RepID=A0A8S1RU84_9CILI|nr:unnamed protein product [Paramecium sonneborni]
MTEKEIFCKKFKKRICQNIDPFLPEIKFVQQKISCKFDTDFKMGRANLQYDQDQILTMNKLQINSKEFFRQMPVRILCNSGFEIPYLQITYSI